MEWGWYISIDINKGKKKIIGYQPEMKINFERTGGFAGIRITAMLDTELMPPIFLICQRFCQHPKKVLIIFSTD